MTTRAVPSTLAAVVLATLVLAGSLLPLSAAAGEVRRGPCPEDAPPGVRLPDRPGCREREAAWALPRDGAPGSNDLGGGASLRIGGRVRAEYDLRR